MKTVNWDLRMIYPMYLYSGIKYAAATVIKKKKKDFYHFSVFWKTSGSLTIQSSKNSDIKNIFYFLYQKIKVIQFTFFHWTVWASDALVLHCHSFFSPNMTTWFPAGVTLIGSRSEEKKTEKHGWRHMEA